ncbi:hypothetical protein HYW42_04855 [Candidatus Daviesbacteria bacterium]|nr:hypothetical protein [Candidatus Daviesbacteria bacterium]
MVEDQRNYPDRRAFLRFAVGSAANLLMLAYLRGTSLAQTQSIKAPSPYRTVADSMAAYTQAPPTPQQLTGILKQIMETPLSTNTKISLAMGHLLESGEGEIPNFSFPVRLTRFLVDDGMHTFAQFSNNDNPRYFPADRPIDTALRELQDRSVCAMNRHLIPGTNGIPNARAIARIELDHTYSRAALQQAARYLAELGVTGIGIGTGPNDPGTPWRDRPDLYSRSYWDVSDALYPLGIDRFTLYPPALEYYGNGEYLDKLNESFRRVGINLAGSDHPQPLPPAVADQFYGYPRELLPRVQLMRQNMERLGIGDKAYSLFEVGFPNWDNKDKRRPERQLAEEHVPQTVFLIMASPGIDSATIYTAFDSSDAGRQHLSLYRADGTRLVPKDTARAFQFATRLTGLPAENPGIFHGDGYMGVRGIRTDGINYESTWATGDRKIELPRIEGSITLTPLGNQIFDNPRILNPSTDPRSYGPAVISVWRGN